MAHKSCDGCGKSVGVRTKECPDCGYKFLIRKRGPRPKEIDWTELKSGDTIKVVSGIGPYFLSKHNEGEKIMMGHKGKFQVIELYNRGRKDRGIWAYEMAGKDNVGPRELIYMGEQYYDDSLSTHYVSHKVLGIKTEATVIESPSKSRRVNKKKEIDADVLNNLIASM